MDIHALFDNPCYAMAKSEKTPLFLKGIENLHQHHLLHSAEYQKIVSHILKKNIALLEDVPFLSVRLFKNYALKSVSDDQIIKTLTSSGTTSQSVSKIYLDQMTSALQVKALSLIAKEFLGAKRLPMLIIDTKTVLQDRDRFSARTAGILGFSNFGRDHTYALDDAMDLDVSTIEAFIQKYANVPIFIFGPTYLVWKYFFQSLKNKNKKWDLSNAILIHGGGWKKLQNEAVDNITFKSAMSEQTGITKIHNFYGMVEQVGSIYMACEAGYFHTPLFSDVIIRNPADWSVMPYEKKGVIQVLSLLPHSYPGHSLLTEDEGIVHGEDDCHCGRMGKYFSVLGRILKAEVRGCSDAV